MCKELQLGHSKYAGGSCEDLKRVVTRKLGRWRHRSVVETQEHYHFKDRPQEGNGGKYLRCLMAREG